MISHDFTTPERLAALRSTLGEIGQRAGITGMQEIRIDQETGTVMVIVGSCDQVEAVAWDQDVNVVSLFDAGCACVAIIEDFIVQFHSKGNV